MLTPDDVAAAAARIETHVRRTPLEVSGPMSERTGAAVAIKAEHTQHTGSFKLRGALNTILSLTGSERAAGVVTASSGNHGIATATAARIADCACTVYLPTGASPAKVAAIARLGATIETVDSTDAFHAEVAARDTARATGRTYVSPYNDPRVMAGQGTVGLELAAQFADIGWDGADAVVVAVGGGGLVSGVATWLAATHPDTVIVGASPANDCAMLHSVAAGDVDAWPAAPTFSDGTAGGLEPGAATLDLCRRLVGEWTTVTETEIATAVTAMIDDHHQLVEGAAGVALAAATAYGIANPGRRVVAITCGANVSSTALAAMLATAGTA
ncbi:MAG: pyridoxal-phosphate dependent enzyme [Actinomycetota bacterium]